VVEITIADLTAAHVSLILSFAAAYGLMLLYLYQVGFFTLVGFEFAGLTTTLDLWSNAGKVLVYTVAIAMGLLVTAFAFQGVKQLGFDLAKWIFDHDWKIMAVLVALTSVPSVILVFLNRRSKLNEFGMILNFVAVSAICYANILVDQRLSIWSFLFGTAYLPLLSFSMGFGHAYSARVLETSRYDIYLENETLKSVRLVRASPSGILYVPSSGGPTCFVSTSKVAKINQVAI